MEKSKFEKREELAKFVASEFQKMITGFMPGGHLIDGFWDYRSNLKQKRLMNFVESLRKVFEDELGTKLETYEFESEDFVDIFESVLNKVQATKSNYKMERFRNILVNQMIDPVQNILTLKFVELLDSLNEVQLILLSKAPNHKTNISFKLVILGLSKDFEDDPMNIDEANTVEIKISDQYVSVNLDDVDFYVNDLVSKGLIERSTDEEEEYHISDFQGTTNASVLIKYKISKTGVRFLNFIKHNS